ncbi:MAG TPA: hypothetical protein VN285_04235 [Candidatus Deferrimicrobium sp.]|nr:hypothetical protein [Candidatus Deferrimicrobium sp.]
MRRPFLLLVSLLMATLCSAAYAATAQEVLQKNIAAKGGAEKLKAVKSKKTSGKTIVQSMELPFTLYQKRPAMLRLETTMQGITMVQAFDGVTGWHLLPTGGVSEPQQMAADQVRNFRSQADFDGPLVGFEEKGFTADLVGQEDLDGSPVYHLKLVAGSDSARASYGEFVTHAFLDAKTFLEKKMTIEGNIEGNAFKVDTYYSDYRKVDGLTLPYSMEVRMGGLTVSKMVMNKIELNLEISESIFKLPQHKTESADSSKG